MNIVRSEKRTGDVVILDDCHFINCDFSECQLRYSGGECKVEDSVIDLGCQIEFFGAAKNTVGLLEQLGFLDGS